MSVSEITKTSNTFIKESAQIRVAPFWSYDYTVVRFPAVNRRSEGELTMLSEYIGAVLSGAPRAVDKLSAPTWALCNDTGDNSGAWNGLLQFDFDDAKDPARLKQALVDYGGFLFVQFSFSGNVFALMRIDAPQDAHDAAAARVYAAVLGYLKSMFDMEDGKDFTLDPTCKKACQARFEAPDADAYVAESDTPGFVYATAKSFSESRMGELARCFLPDQPESPMATAAAISACGCAMDVKSAMADGKAGYPARAFAVVLGAPGSRKTTTLNDVKKAVASIGVCISNPKNAPTLRDHIKYAGTDQITTDEVTPEGKVKTTVKLVERKDRPADPLFVVIDEAGQTLKSRTGDDAYGSFSALLRECNGASITIEAVKSQEKLIGSYTVPANVTALMASTPDQWADYVAATPQTNGEARRILEFWQPTKKTDPFEGAFSPADIESASRILRMAKDMSDLWREGGRVFTPSVSARSAFRCAIAEVAEKGAMDESSALSLVMNYTTLFAAVRAVYDGKVTLTTDDLRSAMYAINLAMSARAALKEREAEARREKPQTRNAIRDDILAILAEAPARRDKLKAKLVKLGAGYMEEFNRMVTNGELVAERAEDGKRYTVRVATEADFANEDVGKPIKSLNPLNDAMSHDNASKPFLECDEVEQENRMLRYWEMFRRDHALREGTRNSSFSALAFTLQQSGMWNEYVRGFLMEKAIKSGLGEWEAGRALRKRKDKELSGENREREKKEKKDKKR